MKKFILSTVAILLATILSQQVRGQCSVTLNEPDLLVAEISGTTVICSGEPVTLTFTVNGGTKPWTLTIGSEQITSSSNPVEFLVTPTTTTTYDQNNVYLTDVNNCPGTLSGTATVTVNPLPTLTNVIQNTVNCEGTGAGILISGLVPNSVFTVYYSIDGVLQDPITGLTAEDDGTETFLTRELTYADIGKILQITGITITGVNFDCFSTFATEVSSLNVNLLQVYRSKQSGDWNNPGTWERSYDHGINWVNTSTCPGESNNDCPDPVATISHTVTITDDVVFRNVVVNASGGSLQIENGKSLTIPAGYSLSVNGTLIMIHESRITGDGSFIINSGATMQVGSASGISDDGASGNIQVNGTCIYGNGVSYLYVSTVNQFTGEGLSQGKPANLTISNDGNTVTLSAGISIDGNFRIDEGTFNASNFSLELGGNWNNNDTFIAGTSTVTFSGNNNIQFITGNNTFYNLAVNHMGSGNVTASGSDLAVTNLLCVEAGSFITSSDLHEVRIETNGILEAGGTLNIRGNWINSGSFIPNNHMVNFSGTDVQTLSGSQETYFYGFMANNSAGLQLDNNQFVIDLLSLMDGIITTGDNRLIVLPFGQISGGTASSHINGRLERVYTSAGSKSFPVGKGGNYRPLTFEYTSLDHSSSVRVEQHEDGLTGDLPANVSLLTMSRYWEIDQTGAGNFEYFVTLDPAEYDPGTDNVVMLKNDNGVIQAHSTKAPNYTNENTFNSLSGFGLGTVSPTTIFADNKATCQGNPALELTATVFPTPDGGVVEFFIDNTSQGSAGVVTTTGTASLIIDPSALAAGTYTITAIYKGFGIYDECSSYPDHNGELAIRLPVGRAYVTPTGAGIKDGSSWENALEHDQFQDALSHACFEEVWVACGTYTPTSYNGIDPGEPGEARRKHFYVLPGLRLYGGFAGNEPPDYDLLQRNFSVNETILSGDIGIATGCYHVVISGNNPDLPPQVNPAIIDGFTIRNGYADLVSSEVQPLLLLGQMGGGMLLMGGNHIISNCWFTQNHAGGGGGLAKFGGEIKISDCLFSDNTAEVAGAGTFMVGVGIPPQNQPSVITGCLYENNVVPIPDLSTVEFNEDFLIAGGAAFSLFSIFSIENSTFSDNHSFMGGAYFSLYSIPLINRSKFQNNTALVGGAIAAMADSFFSDKGGKKTKKEKFPYLKLFSEISVEAGSEHVKSDFISKLQGKWPDNKDNGDEAMIIVNSEFIDNAADWEPQPGFEDLEEMLMGGAVFNYGYTIDLAGCLFHGNDAFVGGAYTNYSGNSNFINITMAKNTANIGGAYAQADGETGFMNSVLWDNMAESSGKKNGEVYSGHQIATVSGTLTVDYSCFPEGESDILIGDRTIYSPGSYNIHRNPQFQNVAGKDFRIRGSSPCVDQGNNDDNQQEFDIRGEGFLRVLAGSPLHPQPVIDMGAYEFNLFTDHLPGRFYVNDDAGGSNDGSCWTNAFNSLQSALERAFLDDVIWVASGIYTPTHSFGDPEPADERMKSFFVPPSVTLYGGFNGTEPENYDLSLRDFTLNRTILSGDIGTVSNCYHVVYSGQDADIPSLPNPTVIDGFTLRNGQADLIIPSQQIEDMFGMMGGGIFLLFGKQIIANCEFEQNLAGIGGGLAKFGGEFMLTDCRFLENNTLMSGGALFLAGVGVAPGEEAARVENCQFESNLSALNDLSIFDEFPEESFLGGGAILSVASIVHVTSSEFISNKALTGGAFSSFLGSNQINRCLFTANSALMGGAITEMNDLSIFEEIFENGSKLKLDLLFGKNPLIAFAISTHTARIGGGKQNNGSKGNKENIFMISNSTFRYNIAAWEPGPGIEELSDLMVGGALLNLGSEISAENCLFYYNRATSGGALCNIHGVADMTNLTFTDNAAIIGGAFAQFDSECNILNSIFWDNHVDAFPEGKNGDVYMGHQIATVSGTITIDYSCYPNGESDIFLDENATLIVGSNNQHSYPHFANSWEKDYRIAGSSPCADKGDNNANDQEFDIRGEGFPRIMPKTRSKDDPVIDMGAYEYNYNTDPPYPCNNPAAAGEISATVTNVCYGGIPGIIGSITEAGTYSGTLEYLWQVTTVSPTFLDIPGSDSEDYLPETGIVTDTWFRRLARVACMSDWSGAAISNVVRICVEPIPVSGLLTKYPDQIIIEPGTTVSATLSPGSGGDGSDILQKRSLEAGSWSEWIPYHPGTELTISGQISAIEIQTYREGLYCNDSEIISVSWTTENTPVAGSLEKTPDLEYICEGIQVSAKLTPGSEGNGIDELEFRTHDGNNWSDWQDYVSEALIPAEGKTQVVIRTRRMSDYHTPSEYVSVKWLIDLISPVAIAKTNEIKLRPDGFYSLIPEDVLSEYYDNETDIEIISITPVTFSCGDIGGIFNVKVDVSDICGNETTVYSEITVLQGDDMLSPWLSVNTHPSAAGTSGYEPCVNEGTFRLTATGQSTTLTDVYHFVYQQVNTHQATIIARLDDLKNGGYAGVMMRGGLGHNAPSISFKTLLYNPNVLIGYRTTAGKAMRNLSQVYQLIRWMKIQKNGNNYKVFVSYNGTRWQLCYSVNINMGPTVFAGIFTESVRSGRTSIAWFDNVQLHPNLKSCEQLLDNEIAESNTAGQVVLYPNPAEDKVSVYIPGNEDRIDYALLDMSGRIISQAFFTGEEAEIKIHHLQPAVYTLRLEVKGEIIVKKLIVM